MGLEVQHCKLVTRWQWRPSITSFASNPFFHTFHFHQKYHNLKEDSVFHGVFKRSTMLLYSFRLIINDGYFESILGHSSPLCVSIHKCISSPCHAAADDNNDSNNNECAVATAAVSRMSKGRSEATDEAWRGLAKQPSSFRTCSLSFLPTGTLLY